MATRMKGVRELRLKLGRIPKAVQREVALALRRGGLAIENRAAQGIIDPPKTGRVYRSRGRKGAKHRASAPGQFPAADTGELHQSLTTVPTKNGPDVIQVNTGANAPYAEALELGTSKMAPRPFMQPSFDENEAKIRQNVRAAIRRGHRKATR